MNGFLRRIATPFLVLSALFLTGCMQEFHVPEADTEDGKAFVRRCSLCHALPNPTRMEYPKWQAVVERMARNIKAHNVPPMSEAEKALILTYLERNAKPIPPPQTDAGVPETAPTGVTEPADAADPSGTDAATVGPLSDQAYQAAGLAPSKTTRQAPGFELTNLSGEPVSLADQQGKLVLLNFWATWCAPCVKEMPTLEHLADTLGSKGLSVLAVSLDKLPKEDVALFVQGYRWRLPVLLDPSGKTGDRYAVRVMPSTYLIGPDGAILGRAFGIREWNTPATVELLTSLLKTV